MTTIISDTIPEFPKKLTKAKKQRGITQGQLARMKGADSQRISKYEKGVLVPTTVILIKLAGALDSNLDYLLREAKDRVVGKIRGAGTQLNLALSL